MQKQKNTIDIQPLQVRIPMVFSFGGSGWIRTIVAIQQQIYSLPPLAAREHSHIFIEFKIRWSWWTDSNPRPADYKSAALPTELHQQTDAVNSEIYYIIDERKSQYPFLKGNRNLSFSRRGISTA